MYRADQWRRRSAGLFARGWTPPVNHNPAALLLVSLSPCSYAGIDLLTALGLGGVFSPEEGAPIAAVTRDFACKPPGWQHTMVGNIWQVLAHIIRHPHTGRARPAPMASLRELPRLQPVFAFIDTHLANPALRVRDLAEGLHCSEVLLRTRASLAVTEPLRTSGGWKLHGVYIHTRTYAPAVPASVPAAASRRPVGRW